MCKFFKFWFNGKNNKTINTQEYKKTDNPLKMNIEEHAMVRRG